MATTTPNYLWSVPTSSDLVKNGATAIETLGDSVDQSLWNVGYGQAGKNKIINGAFNVWQRGTSFSGNGYTADRWTCNFSGATGTVSQQTFTPGTAPVAEYESQFFLRFATTVADDSSRIEQKIENVRTFAGQTVTVSLWAKADSARTITLTPYQNFGSGGSADVNVTSQTISVTTAWTRFTKTFAIPSVSGKTIGTGSFLSLEILHAPNATFTLDLWGVQMEYGSNATPFQTASGGSLQSELAMCQRYYNRVTSANGDVFTHFLSGIFASTTQYRGIYDYPVQMRVAPTSVDYSGNFLAQDFVTGYGGTVITLQGAGIASTGVNLAVTGATAGRAGILFANNSTAVYFGLSAEL
jgi:hypothetical protein